MMSQQLDNVSQWCPDAEMNVKDPVSMSELDGLWKHYKNNYKERRKK